MPDAHDRYELGDAEDARTWIDGSSLPDGQKSQLNRFVDRFPSLTFSRDLPAYMDEREQRDQVSLPPWLRAVRTTLASPDPVVHVRFDGVDFPCPLEDTVDQAWFTLLIGYAGAEQREVFHDGAGVYRIGDWYGTDYAYLGADLENPDDERVLEFAGEDLLDDLANGESPRESLFEAFETYASMLAHIVAVRLPDGTVIGAE
jgi:hypothetical protein